MTEQRDAWNAATAGWTDNSVIIERSAAPIQHWMLEHLDPRPGETFLDIGAGPGPMAIPLARAVAPTGSVIATDLAENMLEVAAVRAADAGVDNITFQQMDAVAIDLPDASFDGAAYRYGPMLVADPLESFRQTWRVLRPGGRYACAAWGPLSENAWNPVIVQPLVERGLIPPPDAQEAPTQMFSLGDRDKLRSLLLSAGFEDVEVEGVAHAQVFDSPDEAWKLPSEIAGGLAAMIARQPADDIAAIKDRFCELLESYRDGDAIVLPAVTNCALATRR